MSDIALIMNGLLGVLLIGALLVGWRLEQRLKALRASHQSFTEALGDLDRAAARAEQGLADLRAATDAAGESLAARIERAGALAGRLEKLTADAASAERRLMLAPRPPAPTRDASPPTRDAAVRQFSERFGAQRAQRGAPAAIAQTAIAQAAARNDLILEDAPLEPAAPSRPTPNRPAPVNERLERLRAMAHPRLDPALRADDDLFEAPEPRRAAGGRR